MASRFDPQRLLKRAEQMRALADEVSDATTKERMLLLAKEYEEQAKRTAIYKPRKKDH
jgi:hypothetical protein